MDYRAFPEFDGHELVHIIEADGFVAAIAIHNTNLGPAVGGTRLWWYASPEDAVRDALRLSRAMTYKCALAGVPYGGGKGVVLASDRSDDSVRTYAREVERLSAPFYTGEDVGIGPHEIELMMKETSRIIGKPGVAGDPSPWAARGVFHAMEAASRTVLGRDLGGMKIAVKGLGKLGRELVRLALDAGARVIGADVSEGAVRTARSLYPALEIMPPDEMHRAEVDIYSPCALGGDLTPERIGELRARIVCGGANNQLATSDAGPLMAGRGIVYIPDYLANAGGLINVVDELDPAGYDRARVEAKVQGIGETARKIIELAAASNDSTHRVADRLAESIFVRQAVHA